MGTYYCVLRVHDGKCRYSGTSPGVTAMRLETGFCYGWGGSPEHAEADCDRRRLALTAGRPRNKWDRILRVDEFGRGFSGAQP